MVVMEHVVLADPHRLVLGTGSPHKRILELIDDRPMDLVAEILHGALSIGEDDWLLIIGKLSLWLGVDPNQLQIIPHLLKKAVVVPFVMCRDRDTVGNLGDDFKLFNRDLVNLVQQVDAGYVVPVPLDNVDEIVNSGVAAKSDVSIRNSKRVS